MRSFTIRCLAFVLFAVLANYENSAIAQVLHLEECFKGGVTGAGFTATAGSGSGVIEIHLEENAIIRRAYAYTHRYGRPDSMSFYLNSQPITWHAGNQIGPEMPSPESNFAYFAVNVQDIITLLTVDTSVYSITLPQNIPSSVIPNQGWWSIYVLVLYEAPTALDDVCIRAYTADQIQGPPQVYTIDAIDALPDSDVGLAVYTDRLSGFFSDRSKVSVNGHTLGFIYTADASNPLSLVGVRGHFYYQNKTLYGLDDDVPDNAMHESDGLAVINEYLQNINSEQIGIQKMQGNPTLGGNAHPAFFIPYTPSCPVIASDAMPRSYTLCRGDSVQLQGVEGFDHYAWSPDIQLSDSTAMSPTCIPDSSRWYRLRMWNDDPAQGCPLTIPVWVEVGDIPRPPNPVAVASSCPNATGRIRLENPPGLAPFVYGLDSITSAQPVFDQVAAGSHAVSVVDARGCRWDSTLSVPLKPAQQAAMQANPTSGLSPLTVAMLNQSSGATSHYWMVDGETFSQAHATTYTFADTGTYALSVVAIRDVFSCADTATIIIRVEQGMQVIMPNIFTPNGDGANDELLAQVLGARDLQWEVYNRWGALMHRSAAQPEPLSEEFIVLWSPEQAAPHTGSGRSPRPEDVPSDGSYILILTAEDLAGRVERMQFVVQLKR